MFEIMRLYLQFKMTGDKAFAQKAYFAAADAVERGTADARVYFAACVTAWEHGQHERAREFLAVMGRHKNYFKNNEPLNYAYYLFCDAFIAFGLDKRRAAERGVRALSEWAEERNLKEIYLAAGLLFEKKDDYANCFAMLKKSYELGMNSPFLYLGLYEYYENAGPALDDGVRGGLLVPLIKWGVGRKFDLTRILVKWMDVVVKVIDLDTAVKVYRVYRFDWILELIVKRMIDACDVSAAAFRFYKEAENRQVGVAGLESALVRAAWVNGGATDDVSRYTLSEYLRVHEPDPELRPFVYHLMLTNPKFADLVDMYKNRVAQFGLVCLENNMDGVYFNSIYKYLLDMDEDGLLMGSERYKSELSQIEAMLEDAAFVYELEVGNAKVKYVWLYEKEKREGRRIELENGKAAVRACSGGFTTYCLTADSRHVVSELPKVTRLVKNADHRLFARMFKKKIYSAELFAALAEYYMSVDAADVPIEGELALEMAANDNALSKGFKARVWAALANYFIERGQHSKALRFYKNLDENYLTNAETEKMLVLYVTVGEFERAADLIAFKGERISEKVLFAALKRINVSESNDEVRGVVAAAARLLILRGWYDGGLLQTVLRYYRASRVQWLELSRFLDGIGVSDSAAEIALAEIVLNGAIDTRAVDAATQNMFVRLYKKSGETAKDTKTHENEAETERLLREFAHYMAYELIVNGARPEIEVVLAIEQMVGQGRTVNRRMAIYGLCHAYALHGLETNGAADVLAAGLRQCEQDGVILPVFKHDYFREQDRVRLSAYIEQNRPFVYKSAPGRDVKLLVKGQGEENYIEKPMKYVGFGLYEAHVPHFWGETLQYCFNEQTDGGSVTTKEEFIENTDPPYIRVEDDDTPYNADIFGKINDALFNESLFKYEAVEAVINDILDSEPVIMSRIV